jgi:hypothetical protein
MPAAMMVFAELAYEVENFKDREVAQNSQQSDLTNPAFFYHARPYAMIDPYLQAK